MNWTRFYDALKTNNVNDVNSLLDTPGVNVNAKNEVGRTMLAIASRVGKLEIAALLIERGADVNEGQPLEDVCINGDYEMAKLLVHNGANVNAKSYDGGMSLLSVSVVYKPNVKIAKLLLVNGADINARDDGGKTVFEVRTFYPVDKDLLTLLYRFRLRRREDINDLRKSIDKREDKVVMGQALDSANSPEEIDPEDPDGNASLDPMGGKRRRRRRRTRRRRTTVKARKNAKKTAKRRR